MSETPDPTDVAKQAPTEVTVRRSVGGLMPLAGIAPAATTPKAADFALFKAGQEDVIELIRENLGDNGIEFSSLTGVSWPSSNSNAFNIETAEGPKAFRDLECVVLRYRDGRVLWGSSFAESSGDPPVCISEDMRIGKGNPGGDCSKCPLSQWGSGRDTAGNPTRGKACQERRRLFVMVPWSLLPIHINVPPTSLKPLKQYFSKLIGLGLPYYSVVTKLSLVKTSNTEGTEYAELTASMSGRLTNDEIKVFRALNAQFDSAFMSQTVVPTMPTEIETKAGAATPPKVAAARADAAATDVGEKPNDGIPI